MLTSFDWSISRHLENQLRRLQALKNQSQETATPQMDGPTSIITQVSRDGEPASNGYMSANRDNKSLRGSIKKKVKSEKQNPIFRSMLCCLGRPKRKPPIDEKPINNLDINNCNETVEGTVDPTPPPTPTILNQTQDDEDDSVVPNGVHDFRYLLPAKPQSLGHKKCAVIDLDETLVHSSFKPISNADFIIPVEIDGTVHQVYVLKRPHVDAYLERMGELYECVLFTASLAKYADPVADLLDKQGVFTSRLFRESCVFHRGNYVKDLSLIGREMNKMIIIDNSPASYIFHPDNAVPVLSWFDDPGDTELLDLLPFLEAIAESEDVYPVLRSHGFTSHAKETTASIQQLQHQLQLQHASEEDEEER